MKQTLARLSRAAPTIARDAVGLAGAGAIVTGVALIHVATALIVGGGMMLGVAVLLARRG